MIAESGGANSPHRSWVKRLGGGGGRESNPPGALQPLNGFEDRGAHQALIRLQGERSHARSHSSDGSILASMSDFGGLIRDAREARGLSPHRVGELIGRASGTVKSWERGRTVPADPHVVTSLAAVLGLDELALFRAAGLNPPDHREALTIEQELATIAPRSAPSDPPREVELQFIRAPAGAPSGAPELASEGVARNQGVETETASNETAQPEESVTDAVTAFLQKGVDVIAEASAPVLEQFRKARKERTRPAPRPIVSHQPVAPSGSYLDDPDEQWSYRLRSLWTAAGVGVLGILLLWAGSRALDALGDSWEALLAGL